MSKYIACVFAVLIFFASPLVFAVEDPGITALKKAEKKSIFLVAYFFDATDEADKTKSFKASVEKASSALSSILSAVYIDVNNKTQQGLVTMFKLSYAPKPIALIFAPNGTIVGSFQKSFTVAELKASLPGPGMQQCLKALQEGKIVMLSIQNKDSVDRIAAMKGVTEFSNDPLYKPHVVTVVIDPSLSVEENSLRRLQISPGTKKATTILLAPPGALVGRWEGALTKDAIALQLSQAMAQSRRGGHSCSDPTCKIPNGGKK